MLLKLRLKNYFNIITCMSKDSKWKHQNRSQNQEYVATDQCNQNCIDRISHLRPWQDNDRSQVSHQSKYAQTTDQQSMENKLKSCFEIPKFRYLCAVSNGCMIGGIQIQRLRRMRIIEVHFGGIHSDVERVQVGTRSWKVDKNGAQFQRAWVCSVMGKIRL